MAATCGSMCPVSEIEFRSRNFLINRLEATSDTCNGPRAKYVADPNKIVKEYSRSAADTHKYNKPELLRPFPVLRRTIDHLLHLYSPFQDRLESVKSPEFASVFSFVSDRLRAVRQDMIMQNMNGQDYVVLIEEMLPFYIETDGMCKMETCSSYEQKLHEFQLEECFGRWFELISCFKIDADSLISTCFFFRQLHRKPTILHELQLFRHKLPPLTFGVIRDVITSFLSDNYCRFFAKVALLEPLAQYSLSDSISQIRKKAIKTISVAFKTPVAKLNLQLISHWLGFPANLEYIEKFLSLYKVVPDENGFILVASIKHVELPDLDSVSRHYQ